MISEARKFRPAARCRACGCVTWVASLARKVKIAKAKHAEGCHRPAGRLDLIAEVPLDLRSTLFRGALERPLADAELRRLEEFWKTCPERSASTSPGARAPGTAPRRSG